MNRHSLRGVTLFELIVAIVVTGILGASVLGLLLSQSRFAERVEGQRAGRRVGRGAINALVNDLRMVDPDWGIESASATALTVKVPYALGLLCRSAPSGGNTVRTIALLPVDSVVLNLPGYSGYATRGNTGVYTPVAGGTVVDQGALTSTCTGGSAGVVPIPAPSSSPNETTRQITITTSDATIIAVGTPVMLYRRTRFSFAPSSQAGLTTRTALWREYLDGGSGPVELAAPFASEAAFRFFNQAATAAQVMVPATLSDIKGIEIFLPGQSEQAPRQRTNPEQADLTTAVFFVNRVN